MGLSSKDYSLYCSLHSVPGTAVGEDSLTRHLYTCITTPVQQQRNGSSPLYSNREIDHLHCTTNKQTLIPMQQ